MYDKRGLAKGVNSWAVLVICFVFLKEFLRVSAGTSPLPVRLVGGIRGNQGYVQVNVNNTWGTICGAQFGRKEATVVCRMLGYYGGGLLLMAYTNPIQNFGPTLFHNLSCYGNETSITECRHTSHCRDVGPRRVNCMSVSDIRLRGGKRDSEGRLEVFYNGQWGSVCGIENDFSKKEGTVACRMLGYRGDNVVVRRNGYYGSVTGKVWLDRLSCTGNESSLFTCQGPYNWGLTSCKVSETVGMDCLPEQAPILPVRLVDGHHPYEGRVQVFHYGGWYEVCTYGYGPDQLGTSWDQKAAQVVCNQLGMTNTTVIPTNGNFGTSYTAHVRLDLTRCHGHERDLGQCEHLPWDKLTTCSDYSPYTIGVMCVPESMQRTLFRLQNGLRKSQGRVEVFYQGKWGTVCQQNFDQKAASVLCRTLGYSGQYAAVRQKVYFGEGYSRSKVWLGNITCNGNETSLFNCQMNPFGKSGCYHSQDVGIDCEPWMKVYLGIRLVNGTTPRSGRIEVHHNSTWATVCDRSWGVNEAAVACNQLGFLHSIPVAVPGAYYGAGTGEILIDGLQCNGTEANIGYCGKHPLGVNNCSHTEDAGLMCLQKRSGRNETVNVRLAIGVHPNRGRVEVQFRQIWGTVCGTSFNNDAANVICRQLGFSGGRRLATLDPGKGPIWMDGLSCHGTETTIADCQFNGWGNNTCNHSQDVAVSCDQSGGVIG